MIIPKDDLQLMSSQNGKPVGADDAKEANIYRIEDIPLDKLVFDHKQILQDYCEYRREGIIKLPL